MRADVIQMWYWRASLEESSQTVAAVCGLCHVWVLVFLLMEVALCDGHYRDGFWFCVFICRSWHVHSRKRSYFDSICFIQAVCRSNTLISSCCMCVSYTRVIRRTQNVTCATRCKQWTCKWCSECSDCSSDRLWTGSGSTCSSSVCETGMLRGCRHVSSVVTGLLEVGT
jgi:hypothetical protein